MRAIDLKLRPTIAAEKPARTEFPLPAWPAGELAEFVSGPENRLAANAVQRVVADPGEKYNPLFFFGPPGAGKSHLLFGMARALKAGGRRVLALSAATFAEWCDAAWRTRTSPDLRERLWRTDALLIDDLQALEGRPAALEELYHAYNRLVADGKQLAFASAQPPARLLGVPSSLRHRFVSGLVVEVATPGPTLLRELLMRHAERAGLVVTRPAADLLGEHAPTARDVLGFVHRLAADPPRGGRVAVEHARELLAEIDSPQVSIDDIARAVCAHYHVSLVAAKSERRLQELAQARQMAMYLARRLTKASLLEIGAYFGGRDHSTALYAIRKTADAVARDVRWGQAAAELEQRLRAAARSA